MIRLSVPSIENDDLEAVRQVLQTGMLVQGANVAAFEQSVSALVQTNHAVAVSNGTATLHLALLALDVRPGDLVIVTSYSWLSTANVVELCGAQPVFTDIEPDTFNMSVKSLEATLERLMANPDSARRVKAILPIHAFGLMADMTHILKLAGRYNLPVIEDAACALGASQHGRQAGSLGVMGSFSFHPRKAVTTGEGGVITANDPDIVWRLKALRNHGLDPNSSTPKFVMPGYNYRLTDFQAALGVTQMAKLERVVKARQVAAKQYDQLLQGSGLQAPFVPEGSTHVYQSYVTLLPAEAAPSRAELITALRSEGIETNIGTWHMPLTDYYQKRYGYRPGDFPNADAVFARAFTLPLFEGITLEQQKQVVERIVASIQPRMLEKAGR
jgi:perosamine synthetase